MSEEIPEDVAQTMYEAVDAMNMQSEEHRPPYAPTNEELNKARNWLTENTDI